MFILSSLKKLTKNCSDAICNRTKDIIKKKSKYLAAFLPFSLANLNSSWSKDE